MKKFVVLLAVAAAVCLAAVFTSCIYDEQLGQLVVTEKICVNFEQTETDGVFDDRRVAPQFRERIDAILEENGATYDDLVSLSVVGGTYKLVVMKGHDWRVTADVSVFRRDVTPGPVMDGPEHLLSFTNQSIAALKGKPTTADLDEDGVDLLNRALEDLLAGEDPMIWLELENTSINPVPSSSDPLELRFLACVQFQAVIDVSGHQ